MENATYDAMLGAHMVPLTWKPPGRPSDRTLFVQSFQEDFASSGPGHVVDGVAPP